MRLRILRQATGIVERPYNRCGCATYRAVEALNDLEREAREGNWRMAEFWMERASDEIRSMDMECGIDSFKFMPGVQQAVRRRDLRALLDAMANIKLRICGEELPLGKVIIPPEEVKEAARRTEEEERLRAAMR